MLTSPSYSNGNFWPRLEKVIFYSRHWQTIYDQFSRVIRGKVLFKSVTQPEVEGLAKLATQRYQASAEKQYQTRMDGSTKPKAAMKNAI